MIMMKELHPYLCLVEGCTGDLFCTSEDPLSEDRMLTHFICNVCKTSHAYIESLHVLPRTQSPEKLCQFCNQQLDYFAMKDSWNDYYKCDTCKAHYRSYLRDVNNICIDVYLYTKINGKTFCLRQFSDTGKSRVDIIPDNLDDTIIVVKEFDFLFPDVTPQNIQDKLPIYILFS